MFVQACPGVVGEVLMNTQLLWSLSWPSPFYLLGWFCVRLSDNVSVYPSMCVGGEYSSVEGGLLGPNGQTVRSDWTDQTGGHHTVRFKRLGLYIKTKKKLLCVSEPSVQHIWCMQGLHHRFWSRLGVRQDWKVLAMCALLCLTLKRVDSSNEMLLFLFALHEFHWRHKSSIVWCDAYQIICSHVQFKYYI